MDLDELQADIDDDYVSDIADHISSAASCETIEDFADILLSAIDAATTLASELQTMLDKTTGHRDHEGS